MMIDLLNNIKNKQILIIGDVMLDHKITGSATRMSPEAPVPLLKIENESFELGGAGNVAKNIVGMGGYATLMGVVGEDKYGIILKNLAKEKNITTKLFVNKNPTILKSRYYSGNYYLFRTDKEICNDISENIEKEIIQNIQNEKFDIIIISDYDKGMITIGLIDKLKKLNSTIIIDPKPVRIENYKGIDYMTPNLKELGQISSYYGLLDKTKNTDEYIKKSLLFLENKVSAKIICTRSEKGITFLQNKELITIPIISGEVNDVTGAGDSTIAAISLALSSGENLKNACTLGMIAGCLAVRSPGTITVTAEMIKKILNPDK